MYKFQLRATTTLRQALFMLFSMLSINIFAQSTHLYLELNEQNSSMNTTNTRGQTKTTAAYRHVDFGIGVVRMDPTMNNSPLTVDINFGDGSPTEQHTFANGSGSVHHYYATSGTKTLSIQIQGGMSATQNIVVRSNPHGEHYVYNLPDKSVALVADRDFTPPCPNNYLPVARDRQVGRSSGIIHVKYGQGNTSGKIRKPVLFRRY